MQVSPWFSVEKPDSRPDAAVYHNNRCCAKGKKVDKYHHRYGTDNRPLCPHCFRFNATGR
jgi:hypothetical protein